MNNDNIPKGSIDNLTHSSYIPPNIEKKMIDAEKEQDEKERQEAREDAREHRQYRHDWKIAIFSTVVGALLSRPLWSSIDWVINLVRSLSGF